MPEPLKLFLSLLGVVAIVVAAYWVTYFVAKKSSSRNIRGKAIRIIDGYALTKDNAVYIIEAAGKMYLIAMTPGGASLIDELDPDSVADVIMDAPDSSISFDKFKESFSAVAKEKFGVKSKKSGSFDEIMKNTSDEEDTSSLGRDNITRIYSSDPDKPEGDGAGEEGDDN